MASEYLQACVKALTALASDMERYEPGNVHSKMFDCWVDFVQAQLGVSLEHLKLDDSVCEASTLSLAAIALSGFIEALRPTLPMVLPALPMYATRTTDDD